MPSGRLRKDGQPDGRAGRRCPRGADCANFRHGHKANQAVGGSPEYRTWRAMKARCTNPKDPAYSRYGGRGITVDPAWLDSFEVFLADMGPRPNGMSLDRADNNKGYTKSNCRWATRSVQGSNRRSNNLITVDEVTKTITQWACDLGVDPGTIRFRLKQGWSVRDAVTKPKRS